MAQKYTERQDHGKGGKVQLPRQLLVAHSMTYLCRYSSTLRASSVKFAPFRCMLTSGSCMALCWLG